MIMSEKRKGCVAIVMATLSAGIFAAGVHAAPTAYQSQVLSENPSVYCQFNDSGTTAVDAAAGTTNDLTGNNGTYVGSPTEGVAGFGSPSDNAVQLNGSTQYVNSTDTAFGAAVTNSSYEFVFKVNPGYTPGTAGSVADLFGSGKSGAENIQITLGDNGANTGVTTANDIRFFVRDTGGTNSSISFNNSSWANGSYHDLILTFSYNGTSDTINAYLDGVLQTQDASFLQAAGTHGFAAFTNDPAFGALDNNGTQLTAPQSGASTGAPVTIDEAALYPYALTQAQVSANYGALTSVPEPASLGLVALAGVSLSRRSRSKHPAGT
jgi:hypothetical protein